MLNNSLIKAGVLSGLTLSFLAFYCNANPLVINRQEYECGLAGVRTNSSEMDPIMLPGVPENVPAELTIWTTAYFGGVRWADVDPTSDIDYLTFLYHWDQTFYIITNHLTRKFAFNENRTIIEYYNRVYCNDGNITSYFFQIPVIPTN